MESDESCRTEGNSLDKGWVKQLDGTVGWSWRMEQLNGAMLSKGSVIVTCEGVMKLADGVKLSKWRYNCQMGVGKIVDRK